MIGNVLVDLKADGIWRGDLNQQRKIMLTFAWVTGEKPFGAYTHFDAVASNQGIQQSPARGFYYGSFSKGAMSRPLCRVVAELPPMTAAERRSHKTIHRNVFPLEKVTSRRHEAVEAR